jgi:hypothetical protein
MSNPEKDIMDIEILLGVALFLVTEIASAVIPRPDAQVNEEAHWDIAVGAVALSTSAAWKGGNTQFMRTKNESYRLIVTQFRTPNFTHFLRSNT